MQDQELRYEIQLKKIQRIALSGIRRAGVCIKFAETGAYDLEKINNPPRKNGEIFTNDSTSPIREDDFQQWQDTFKIWTFNNAVNEIIESFFVFLEMSYFSLHANGTRRRVNSGDILSEVIKSWKDEVRNDLRTKNKIQALSVKGLNFSDDEKQIIESFWEVRNLLSHNLGIADVRKKLDVDQGKITLKWYRREIFTKLESGREIPITGDPMPEAGNICLRPRALQTKEIKLNTLISFSLDEVQQIAWTFWLLVHSASEKIKKIFNEETTQGRVSESA
jgi:hypothetical protein